MKITVCEIWLMQKQNLVELKKLGDRAVLKEINRLLKLGGSMVLDLADGDYIRENFSPRSWEWIDDETFACRERTLSADRKRLHSREVVVVTGKGVVRDQFYSERLYGRQELVQLLREAGFDIEGGDVERIEEEGWCFFVILQSWLMKIRFNRYCSP
jgi:hypothetical protein